MDTGQWGRAEDLLAQAVKTCPANGDAHRAYAEALWNGGQRERALMQIREAIRLNDRDPLLFVRAAEMQLAQGRTEFAMQAAQRAVDLDPKLAAAWSVRARIHRANQANEEALADFHRALGYDRGNRALEWEIAELYRQMNQPQRALTALQTLADQYPPGEEPQAVLYSQGLALLELGRANDAAETLAVAAGRGGPNPDVLYQLAQAQWQAGQAKPALDAARQALDLSPNHEPSRKLLDEIQFAQRPGLVER